MTVLLDAIGSLVVRNDQAARSRVVRSASFVVLAAYFLFLLPNVVLCSSAVSVESRRVRILDDFEGWMYSPIVVEGELVLPNSRDGQWGVSYFPLDVSAKPRFERVRTPDATFNPLSVGRGRSTWWIWTLERRWLVLDSERKPKSNFDGMFATPAHPPVVLGNRAIVYGYARAEITGTESAYLFELTAEGECVPVLEFEKAADPKRRGLEYQWDGALAGGLGRSPDGGFAFIDPRNYRLYLFDRNARLKKVVQGGNPRWRPPNWSAVEPAAASADAGWWRWAIRQITPKAPVFLDAQHVAVLVGYPTVGKTGQSIELDVYRTDGTPIESGVPVPKINGVGRAFVAQRIDPQPGDDILIIIEPDFPPSLDSSALDSRKGPPELWAITVILNETETPKAASAGTNEK